MIINTKMGDMLEDIENVGDNRPEIMTLKDVEEKMCPELREGARYAQHYLVKRFLKIYESLTNGSQQLDDDTLGELNEIWEAHLSHKNLLKQAMVGARAAIYTRNLSHNVSENLIFPNDRFQKFLSFCDIGKIETKELGINKFEILLQKDAENLKNSELNKQYVKLREEGKSPIEAIKMLPWRDVLMSNMSNGGVMLPSNDEMLEGSKMGSTEYCLGRINTILGIIVLNEGIDYLDKHFRYADVLKDGAEDALQRTPKYQRGIGYLVGNLELEDPHQILIYVDDDGTQQDIDPSQIGLEQYYDKNLGLENITKTYEGKVSEIAYEIYFLNYINAYFNELEDLGEKKRIARYIELCNRKYGLSYTILKRIINFAIQMGDTEMENEIFGEIKKLADEYPCIKNTFAYQMKLNDAEKLKMNEFIHEKYGSQFDLSDALSILGAG